MRIHKITVLLLSFILVLAACSSGNSNGSNQNQGGNNGANHGTNQGTNENTSSQNNEETVEEDSGTPEMEFDMGGRTIKIVSWWDMTIPEDNPDNIQRKANLEALMEKHNFKVEYIALDYEEYQDKVVASLMAGEPLGDIIRMGKAYMIPSLVKQDLFWPVDEYITNDKVFNLKVTQEYSQFEGRGYGFFDGTNIITGIYYNRTLMNNLGMKPLQEYVDEDNWTWETFIQVAKEANKDTNNDGKLDTWGLASGSFLDQAMAANETDYVIGNQQNLDDPKVVEAFNFISRLATENVARPTEGGDWTEPSVFFRQGNTLMYAGADYEASGIKQDMQDYDIGFLPFPKGPSASTYHAVEPALQYLTIPKKSENPEQLIYIWEKINDIESIYDYPGQAALESNFDNETDIENALIARENMNIIDRQSFPSIPYYDLLGELTSGVSVSTVIEKYKATFQSAIDEVYKQ
ncbi:ABC transporter substrate-binding protein [Marinicrinis lubricantis]|uniref:ABC transporter substrate-binding protein n=1 Tax=Marinicrinis lubricantis TaxID=2086470 RepID=A0ABW1IVP9_9BACL